MKGTMTQTSALRPTTRRSDAESAPAAGAAGSTPLGHNHTAGPYACRLPVGARPEVRRRDGSMRTMDILLAVGAALALAITAGCSIL